MSTCKKNKVCKYILAIAFSAILLFFFITITERAVRTVVWDMELSEQTAAEKNNALNTEDNSFDPSIPDWNTLYPHEADEQDLNSEVAPNVEKEEAEKKPNNIILSLIDLVKEKIDYYSTYMIVGRMRLVEINFEINSWFGLHVATEKDNVIFMKNDYLTIRTPKKDTTQHVELLQDFDTKLKKQGIDFLYVQNPSKEDKYNNLLPHGLEDNNNANSDELIQRLAKTNINYIDIREVIHEQKLDHYSLFFKTDHHWKPETGLWATKVIAEKINETTDFEIDTSIFEKSNFKFETYEDFFLGSHGKNLTLSRVDPEDFTLVTPKTNTDFTVNYYDSKLGVKKGTFEETMIYNKCLTRRDYYGSSQYDSYIFGDTSILSITNNLVDNDYYIVFISDSFSNTVVPFLSMGVKRIDKIDSRDFTANIEAYIEKNKPDLVIVAYSSIIISQEDVNIILDFS